MKAIILARVSTKEQEEGYSIDAQLNRLQAYCERKGLDIIKEFNLTESSTRGKRPEFHKMIDFVKSQQTKIAIVVDAVDRLQRSFKESAVLGDLINQAQIELHFLRENMFFDENSKNYEKVFWDMSVLMAKSYVGSLADNVKRSQAKMLQDGIITGNSPVGYINTLDVDGNKTVIIDPQRGFLVKKIFEQYATGLYSLSEIRQKTIEQGLQNKTKKANYLTTSQVHQIIQNTFYYGCMKVNGILYPHNYDCLISKDLFNKCEDVRLGRTRKSTKNNKTKFIFRGMIKCPKCGCLYSPEIKKGKYIYLRPSSKNGCDCKQVNENVVLEQIEGVLSNISIPENILLNLKNTLKNSLESKKSFQRETVKVIRYKMDKIDKKLNELLDMRLDKSITTDVYNKKSIELNAEKHNLKRKLDNQDRAEEDFAITLNYLLDIASRSKDIFKSSEIDVKRKIVNLVFSNLTLDDKKLGYSLNKPFNMLLNLPNHPDWLGNLDSNQD